MRRRPFRASFRAMSARARYAELVRNVDAFVARVEEKHRDAMQCRPGCHDCCHARFSVTAIEAEVLAEALEALPVETRARLAAQAAHGDPDVCPALVDDGRCAVYEARPLVCRSHGVPIRLPSGPKSLPVVSACFKNFTGEDLASVERGSVLDQTTLSTILHAVDAAHAAEVGRPPGHRVDIAALLST